VTLRLEKTAVIVAPYVGVGGAEPHPRRIAAAEALLAGRAPETRDFPRRLRRRLRRDRSAHRCADRRGCIAASLSPW